MGKPPLPRITNEPVDDTIDDTLVSARNRWGFGCHVVVTFLSRCCHKRGAILAPSAHGCKGKGMEQKG